MTMQNSKIEWTDHTFNPWWGCQRVSPGCEHCYAETMAHRYNFRVWGAAKTTERRAMSANYWRQPLKWNRDAERDGVRRRVFCASMADVFEDHPQVWDWRQDLFGLIEETQHLDWLLLTKRPEHIRAMLPADWLRRPRANVWLGTSVEDQRRADERIPHLLRVPARVRFLSCEPLLGALDLSAWLICETCKGEGRVLKTTRIGRASFVGQHTACPACNGDVWRRDLSWVIVGGESGPGARPMHPDWARRLREDCQNTGVPVFFKQWGEFLPCSQMIPGVHCSEGEDHNQPDNRFVRLGKGAAGRLLDGREWNELPR